MELVRFLSRMNSLVNPEVGLLSKGCAIVNTLVWFLSSMNPLMKPKVWTPAKSLATFIVKSLSSMGHLVFTEASMAKRLATLYLLHFYDLSPAWILWWIVMSDHCWKALPHSVHLYGFSPVWILSWYLRCEGLIKALPHSVHLYGLSPVWILSWCLRYEGLIKALPHSLHL